MTQIDLAKSIAQEAHKGQTRRDGKVPYIQHVEQVAKMVNKITNGDVDCIAAAYLHDVLEDTNWTPQMLRTKGVSDEIIQITRLLDKGNLDYFIYIRRLKESKQAIRVKVADIVCNLSDAPTESQKVKYATALAILAGVYDK